MKTNKKNLIPIAGAIFFAIIIFLHSCIKDSFDFDKLSPHVQYNPNFAVPIAYASLDLWDFLQDYDSEELIISDPVTGFLSIVYSKRVFSLYANDIINISDQNYSETFTDIDVNNAGGISTNPYMIKENIDGFAVLAGELLDSMVFKSANLKISVSSSFLHTGTLVITFPEMKKNGSPYSKTIYINPYPYPYTEFNYNDLNGYSLDLSNFGTDTNKVFIRYELTLVDEGNPVIPGENVSINVSFTDIEFSILYGYVGQPSFDIPSNRIHLEIYDNALSGDAYFKDPKINIRIQNSCGLPVQFWLDSLYGIDTLGNPHPITGSGIPSVANPKLINYPKLSLYQVGQTIPDSIILDTNSCNIREVVFESLPNYISFKVNAEANPFGETQQNFVLDTSRFNIDLEIELPCWGYASYFLLQDTADFDFVDEVYTGASEEDSLTVEDLKEDFQWALFRINIDNGFPVKAEVQVILTDSLYQPVYYLYTSGPEQIIAAGRDTNGDKKVDTPTHKVTDVMFTKENVDVLMDVKHILFRGSVSTTDHDQLNPLDVKFYESYKIDIHVGLQIEYDINTSDY